MQADAEIDLGDRVQPGELEHVDQHPELDAVPGDEGQAFEHLAPARVLPREWLEDAASSGQCMLIRGRATSSVTRPPPCGTVVPPLMYGRS